MIQMGKLLRQLRKQQGLTQEELGKGIISKPELSRVENGLREPDILVLDALFKRLGASLEYFELVVTNREYEKLKETNHELLTKTVVTAESDLIKDIRKARGWSQERLSENICARETVSNIENGRPPKQKMLEDLLEKLGEPRQRYFGYVESEKYEIYPLVKSYQEMLGADKESAAGLLRHIKKKLDKNFPVNLQFIESSEIMEKAMNGLLKPEEELAALEECLRYTMPEYDGNIYRIPHRQEVIILKEINKIMEKK